MGFRKKKGFILRYLVNGKWPVINWNLGNLRYDVIVGHFCAFCELGGKHMSFGKYNTAITVVSPFMVC